MARLRPGGTSALCGREFTVMQLGKRRSGVTLDKVETSPWGKLASAPLRPFSTNRQRWRSRNLCPVSTDLHPCVGRRTLINPRQRFGPKTVTAHHNRLATRSHWEAKHGYHMGNGCGFGDLEPWLWDPTLAFEPASSRPSSQLSTLCIGFAPWNRL
jgi:hypothetical protein